jgi:hypothetical protein
MWGVGGNAPKKGFHPINKTYSQLKTAISLKYARWGTKISNPSSKMGRGIRVRVSPICKRSTV